MVTRRRVGRLGRRGMARLGVGVCVRAVASVRVHADGGVPGCRGRGLAWAMWCTIQQGKGTGVIRGVRNV